MGVYIYQSGVEKEMQNAYIGEYGWQPGANTILYAPLNTKNGITDLSGNYTLTGGSVGTYDGIECFYGGKNVAHLYTTTNFSYSQSQIYTMNFWGKASVYNSGIDFLNQWSDSSPHLYNFFINQAGAFRTTGNKVYGGTFTGDTLWHNYCIIFNVGTYPTYYIDNVQMTLSLSSWSENVSGSRPLYINSMHHSDNTGYISRVIIEDKARDETERTGYYNLTKGNYGL